MSEVIPGIEKYGLWIVFANVFLQQIGVPIPLLPTLVVAGALSASAGPSILASLGTAIAASVIADLIWYLLGKRYGYRVLRLLCRLSISPDSCVRSSEELFTK